MIPINNLEDTKMFIGELVAFEDEGIKDPPHISYGYVDNPNRITCFGETFPNKSPIGIRILFYSSFGELRMRKIIDREACGLLTKLNLKKIYYAPKEEQEPYSKLQLLVNQYLSKIPKIQFVFGHRDGGSIISNLPKEILSYVVCLSNIDSK